MSPRAACTALLLILALPCAVKAQPREETREQDPRDVALALARAGLELLEAGDAAGAYQQFLRAEQHFHAPTHVIYMARAQAQRGLLLEARAHYREVLAEEFGEGATRPYLQAQVDAARELRNLEARIPRVTIELRGLERASVHLDGAPLSEQALAVPLAVNPGEHVIVVEAPGGERMERRLRLAERQSERVVLEKRAPAPLPRPPPPAPPDRRDTDSTSPWLAPAVVAFGVGVLGITAGTVMGVVTLDRVEELDGRCPGRVCPEAEEPGAEDTRALAHAATAAFVIGGASVVAGTVLCILRPGERDDEVDARVELRGGGLWIDGAF